jgi:hypothetical protein
VEDHPVEPEAGGGAGGGTARGRDRTAAVLLLLLAGLLAGAAALVVYVRQSIPTLTERQVRESVVATLRREADTSFVVTGYVDLVVTVRAEDSRVLLPDLLDIPLGTSHATVRVPGRVSYGFDLAALEEEGIRLAGDTVEVRVPPLAVYSVEPELARLEVETRTGWARLPQTAREAERRAVGHLSEALRGQGEAHLEDAVQPRVNTARTLQRLLAPALRAGGIAEPHFRIRMGDDLVVEPAPP